MKNLKRLLGQVTRKGFSPPPPPPQSLCFSPVGTSRYSLMNWSGDQNVDWSYSDGLPSTLPAALSLGLTGFGLNHFDIGGYTTITVSSQSPRNNTFEYLPSLAIFIITHLKVVILTDIPRTGTLGPTHNE